MRGIPTSFLTTPLQVGRRHQAVCDSFEAFEPSQALRQVIRGLTSSQNININLSDAWDAIEPVDFVIMTLLWALAKEDGVISKMMPKKERNELSVLWALWRPVRNLLSHIYPLFYALDVCCAISRNWGMKPPSCVQPVAATLGYAYFLGNLLRSLKRVYFARTLIGNGHAQDEDTLASWRNRLNTVDRVGDAVVCGVVAGTCLEMLAREVGFRLTSLLAFGGVGSLVLGLACQTPLANVISGVIVAVTNPFELGDEIGLEGIEGYVDKLGWYTTSLRGADDQIFQIPNSLIAGKTVINYSRMKYKRFAATLRLRRRDPIEKLLPVLRSRLADLPDIVDDHALGLTLRVALARYSDDGQPEIDIEAHVKTSDDDYMIDWKQTALLEIRAALDSLDCDFALKTSLSLRNDLETFQDQERTRSSSTKVTT